MCLTLLQDSPTDRMFLGSRRNSARTEELHGPRSETSEPMLFKRFQAGGLFGNSLSGLHNVSKQIRNRNWCCLTLKFFGDGTTVSKEKQVAILGWDFQNYLQAAEVAPTGEAQLLQLREPLKHIQSPWHISLITVQLKTLHSQLCCVL